MPALSGRVAVVVLTTTALVTAGPAGTAAEPHDATPRTAVAVWAQMTEAQRVGQLFMVGTPATSASAATLAQIGRYHVGNVMLTGRSHAGTSGPARVAAMMQSRTTRAATAGVRLLVSTDQEGGSVQVLHGHGISEMPTALAQGRFSTARLRSAAGTWARQLRASGVNMNLAPVLDTVPAAARRNPPIGAHDREFGYSTFRVASHGTAFAAGMDAHGVVPTVKHFPGLGRVTRNTDTSSGVTDRVTRRGDAYLTPFETAIRSGHAPFVMMSTAYYSRMDKQNPASFSSFIIGTVLRHDLGFAGAVISDDLANARQLSPWSYGTRAVKFIRAGGDVVLTVNPKTLPAMYAAVLSRARRMPAFRAKVDRAALLVLRAKERRDLLGR
jgi:beta-N-acetylhexosaminidase